MGNLFSIQEECHIRAHISVASMTIQRLIVEFLVENLRIELKGGSVKAQFVNNAVIASKTSVKARDVDIEVPRQLRGPRGIIVFS